MDAGGKIRTANILKNMKGGAFRIDLIAPAHHEDTERWAAPTRDVCDEFHPFAPDGEGVLRKLARAAAVATPIPVAVRSEARRAAGQAFRAGLERSPDLVVFDYVHSLAMAPMEIAAPSLFFAHNVETEIFRRHADLASGPMALVWRREAQKMARFERAACARVDAVIAVSERDAAAFRADFDARAAFAIPTGVDLDFFSYSPPRPDDAAVVTFVGSLDWRANQDGLYWFMNDVWPLIAAARPDASFRVVGKNPPAALIGAAREKGFDWTFTGFVDDVRDHARGAVSVIPLRAGGGTRIKAFEAMAMGVPVVSTGLGVEGLSVRNDEHYLEADEPGAFAARVVRLLDDAAERAALAERARALCEEHFSHARAAQVFERACLDVLAAGAREQGALGLRG